MAPRRHHHYIGFAEEEPVDMRVSCSTPGNEHLLDRREVGYQEQEMFVLKYFGIDKRRGERGSRAQRTM